MSKKLVEVARSFSFKLNVGNYESRDFFCSQKAEVPEDEAEKTSEALYQFCKNEVIKSVNEFKKIGMKEKIDFSNLAENMPAEHFNEQPKPTEDEKEGMMQREINNKQENKFQREKDGSFTIIN